MSPSSRSMLSRDKRLPLDFWDTSGLQENGFLVINFLRLIFTEIILKEFTLVQHQERQDQFHKQWRQEPFFTRDDKQNRGTIPMPTFAGRPSTMSSTIHSGVFTEFYGWTAKTANIGIAIRQIPYTVYILILEDEIQKLVLIAHRRLWYGSKK